jgi:methylenetetrahydrofolate--tRNA-(uracil-5-)-methyltransferase
MTIHTRLPLRRDVVRVVGAGLAGCEAALQLANAGLRVDLYEMKPNKRTPAQVSDHFAELVCSNSFRSNNIHNAVGLIKEEMRRSGGFLVAMAETARVPAGDALAVDREQFAALVEGAIYAHPLITVHKQEVETLWNDDVATIVATGPLTSDALSADIARVIGRERLAFYDAIAPILDAESIDLSETFFESRWGKGEGADYLNCPLTKEQYVDFVQGLIDADQALEKPFEKLHYFEGCLPIEEMARRGVETLRFGPFKPVGLTDPRDGRRPYAVLQLRKEDIHGSAYNLVGCQTRMLQGKQREVFGIIPALKNARFARYGAIHRNTYLDAPAVLDDAFSLKREDGAYQNIFFAGQITGVEGYVESMACGLLVSRAVRDVVSGRPFVAPSDATALGGLYRHTRGTLRAFADQKYVPSNVTWSMVRPDDEPFNRKNKNKDEKRARLVARALSELEPWTSAAGSA